MTDNVPEPTPEYRPGPGKMVTPEQGSRGLKAIWGGMLIILAVLYMLPLRRGADLGGAEGLVFPAALAVAAGAVFVQMMLKRNLTDDRLFPRLLDMGSWSLPEESKASIRELRLPDRGVVLIIMAHFIFNLIIWLIADGIAVLGKVVGFLTGDRGQADAIFAVAALSMVYFRPRGDVLAEQAKRWRRHAESGRG